MNIAALKEAAEKATPGPWNDAGTSVDDFGREYQASLSFEWMPNGFGADNEGVNENYANDATFIALANPSAILSLIERLTELETALRLAEGRISLLLRVFPEPDGESDHPSATRYVLDRVCAALSNPTETVK